MGETVGKSSAGVRRPGGSIENGILKINHLTAAAPEAAEALVLDLYDRLPAVRITGLLLEIDNTTSFTDTFANVRTDSPCKDSIGLVNALLAKSLNLGLGKMVEATNTYDYLQLSRLSRWHIQSDEINRVLTW